jgi:hypothetical protein
MILVLFGVQWAQAQAVAPDAEPVQHENEHVATFLAGIAKN